jgi:hypothetical protein
MRAYAVILFAESFECTKILLTFNREIIVDSYIKKEAA